MPMEAVQVPEAGGEFEVIEREIPDPGPEQVRIEVSACGVCRGDEAAKENAYGIEYPRIPGHEVVGRIDEVGRSVSRWSPGDRVGVNWYGGHCFECDPCRRGDFVNCEQAHITGCSGDGGYAEFVVVNREALIDVPETLDAALAAPLTCAGLTAFSALRQSPATAGDLVAIQGIGGVGHLGVQIAAAAGYETVAVSRGTEKRQAALDLGADHFVDGAENDPAAALQALGGADVILATAPFGPAITEITSGLAPNGELVAIAPPQKPVELELGGFVDNRWSLQGWSSGDARAAEDALAFCARNDVLPAVETYPLHEAPAAYDDMMANDVRFRAVLVP